MAFRICTIILCFIFCIGIAHAQLGIYGNAGTDHVQGKVLVKVKAAYKAKFQGNSAARSSFPFAVNQIKPLAAGGVQASDRARTLASRPHVDIGLYFELTFDPSVDVGKYIDDLYQSGWIEVAEPVYAQTPFYTPNDPDISKQYYLDKIKAYDGWDITKGSENIIIGIVDTGVDIDHPDIASQLYINTADPVNGIDDDQNGFVDDIHGWDFSGVDETSAGDPSFHGDNDPSIHQWITGCFHGTAVGSLASAAVDNNAGMAGVGYNARLLFTKHFSDTQSGTNFTSDTYQGVLYVAHQGAKIINCSWGSNFKSQIYQDIIKYVALDLGCVVVAAAGNSNNEAPIYPASYDYVISVASTDVNDLRADFSSYGNKVDICAPGTAIYFASYDNSYGYDQGTSLSSPLVAGAAALVWSIHPEYTAEQIGQQLRISADDISGLNPGYAGKLGSGRLNILRALTDNSPAIRASNGNLFSKSGGYQAGDTLLLYFDFKNYLHATTSSCKVHVSSGTDLVTMVTSDMNLGVLQTMATLNNGNTPFRLRINEDLPYNFAITVTVDYTDANYSDQESFTFIVNPSYLDINENLITTSLSAIGRIGYDDPAAARGSGFVFDDHPMLYEMGLITGSSSSTILDAVRGLNGLYDHDFVPITPISYSRPGWRSYAEVSGQFSNSTEAPLQQIVVSYQSLVWKESPRDKFVIVEYTIKNVTGAPLDNFYAGLFADWDISANGAADEASWNTDRKLGYVFAKNSPSLPLAGIQLLTDKPQYYAIDNNQSLTGNPFGLYDGFTDEEKFAALSSSAKIAAGTSVSGEDVSHVVAAGPFNIQPQASVTVAFALHAAKSYEDLEASAAYADSVYNYTLEAPRPVIGDRDACEGTSVTLSPSGASYYKLYKAFTGGSAIAAGNQFLIPALRHDTTLYISNADHSYESVRTPVHIAVHPNPVADFVASADNIESNLPISFANKSMDATSFLWNFGDETTSTDKDVVHTFARAGTYNVTLTSMSAEGCTALKSKTFSVVTEVEQMLESSTEIFPVPANNELTIRFLHSAPAKYKLLLTDVEGRVLLAKELSLQAEARLDVQSIPSGLYFLRIDNGVSNVVRKVVIIR
jgi:subtilisin family serine protease